jgi:hypothetical protein
MGRLRPTGLIYMKPLGVNARLNIAEAVKDLDLRSFGCQPWLGENLFLQVFCPEGTSAHFVFVAKHFAFVSKHFDDITKHCCFVPSRDCFVANRFDGVTKHCDFVQRRIALL